MRIAHTIRMTVITFVAFTLLASGFVHKAAALDLYNDDALMAKLKKNQVLSDKDIAELKNNKPKLELRGSIQLQYLNAQANTASDRVSDLYLRRLNLTIAAHVSDKASFVIEPEYGRGEPTIKDAYLEYKPVGFEIIAGNHRVPFSAEALNNDINLSFAERNRASEIAPDRLPGISILKKLFSSKVLVQAGIWNGNINSNAESNLINNILMDNRVFSASSGTTGSNILVEAIRVGYYSNGRDDFYANGRGFENDENFSGGKSYGVGFSFFNSASVYDRAPANGLTGLNGVQAYEGDLTFKAGRLSTGFEYGKRRLDWWQYNFTQTSSVPIASIQTVYFAQASFLVNKNLSVSLRQESFVYDSNSRVLKGVAGQNEDVWTTFGLNYYLKDQNTKIQANYVKKDETMPAGGGASPTNNAVLLQATTYF